MSPWAIGRRTHPRRGRTRRLRACSRYLVARREPCAAQRRARRAGRGARRPRTPSPDPRRPHCAGASGGPRVVARARRRARGSVPARSIRRRSGSRWVAARGSPWRRQRSRRVRWCGSEPAIFVGTEHRVWTAAAWAAACTSGRPEIANVSSPDGQSHKRGDRHATSGPDRRVDASQVACPQGSCRRV